MFVKRLLDRMSRKSHVANLRRRTLKNRIVCDQTYKRREDFKADHKWKKEWDGDCAVVAMDSLKFLYILKSLEMDDFQVYELSELGFNWDIFFHICP